MGLFDRLVGRRETIATADALTDFIDSRAAFLAQKCVVEFCRVRAGVYWQKLFSEEEFRTRLTLSCWQSFPPAVAMLAEMVDGVLRAPAALEQRRLPAALEALAREVFARHPQPAGVAETFWADGLAMVRQRLDATQAAAPRPVSKVAEPMAKLIHAALPLHQHFVAHDYDYIRNNLRMNLLRAHDDLINGADLPALAADVLGRG